MFRHEIPALGRPANLGMLYDRNRNRLIMGKTLWSHEQLKSNTGFTFNGSTKMKTFSNESISENTFGLKIDGRLKLDILCNTVDVQGAASYFNEKKDVRYQARVVLWYETKTQVEYLTMEHLEDTKISHPEVLEPGNATHFVVGIQYGGNVAVEFVEEITEEESSKRTQVEIKAAAEEMKKIISGSVNGNGNYTTDGTGKTKKIKWEVYSDFPIEIYPSTYEEAVQCFPKLSSLTGNGKIGVPVVLYLSPIYTLGILREKRAKSTKEISAVLIDKAYTNIKYLQSVLAKCKNLIEEDNFPILQRQLKLFMETAQDYMAFFQEKISQILTDNYALDDFLKEQETTAFSPSKIAKWLFEKKEAMKTLQSIIKSLDGTPFVSKGELHGCLCDPKMPHVVCLTFKIYPDQDSQLLNMQAFLKNDPTKKYEETVLPDITLVRKPLKRFMAVREYNKDNRVVKCVAMEEPFNSSTSG